MRLCVGALIVKQHCVLLGLRAAHKSFAGCWDIFGGSVEFAESLGDALVRELREELCIVPEQWTFHSSHAHEDIELHLFRVEAWSGTPTISDTEHVEINWFPFHEAASLERLASMAYQEIFRALGN